MVTELRSGMHVGRYRLVDRIAQGGMGSVWSARDERLDRMVAIKMLPRILVTDPSAERRFEREARAMGRLQHPNVVTIFDVGSVDPGTGEELPYLVMELIQGLSLDHMVADGPVETRKAVRVMEQVARALAAAHDAGIVHRDLKPSNVMVSGDGHVKVLDFGLARIVHQDGRTPEDTLTTPGMVLGSCPYMAPEQALGQQVSPASDVFSCGAVLFEALTGRRAFDGATPMKVLQAVVRCEYPDVRELQPLVSPALAAVLDRCMQKDPERRYRSGHALADDLASLAESGEYSSASVPTIQLPVKGSFRIGGLSATRLLGAAVCAALLGTALGFLGGRHGTERLRPDPGQWRSREILSARGSIRHPAWSPDGARLAVDLRTGGGGQIIAVSVTDGSVQVIARPHDRESLLMPRYSPDGRAMVFSVVDGESDKLRIIPAVGGEPYVEIDNAVNGAWLDPERVVFSRHGDRAELWLYDLVQERERLARPAEEGRYWWGALVRPGGGVGMLGGVSESRTGLFVAGAIDRPVRQWLPPSEALFGYSWLPHGDSVVASLNGRLMWIREDGATPLLPGSERLQDPCVSPDGGSLAVVEKTMTNDLIEVDIDGGGWSCLLCGVPDTGFGCVAVDGSVVYRRLVGDHRRLVIRSPDGDERWLSDELEEACCPSLSPDGRSVAYLATNAVGVAELRLRSLSGGRETILASGLEPSEFPSWSPDGRMIAFAGGEPVQVLVVPVVGGVPRAMSPPGGDYPVWSPGGDWIAYTVWTDATDPAQGAWVVAADGGASPRKISDLPNRVVWDLEGQHLRQLRRIDEHLEVWEAPIGSWRWTRAATLDIGGPAPVHLEFLPLAVHPASCGLVMNRRDSVSRLSIFEGLQVERW